MLPQFVLLLCVLSAHADTRWSRQIYNTRLPVRERRQFNAGDWIPLTQPCLTCRPVADPADAAAAATRLDDIGLTPPRPPVTRQIHNTNFFPDESSILQAPPPPAFPSRHHGVPNFQDFLQQFTAPVQFPGQQYFPQTQQPAPFLQQSFLNTPNTFLFGNNQPLFNNPLPLNPTEQQNENKEQRPEKVTELPQPQLPPQLSTQLPSQLPPQPPQLNNFQPPQQHNKQVFTQDRTRLELPLPDAPLQFLPQPQMLLLNPSDPFLTPPPVQNGSLQLPQIQGLEKEEIQLLYVPVETLRQRGQAPQPQTLQQQQQPQTLQHHQPQKVQYQQFGNQQVLLRPFGQPNGHFITQTPVAPAIQSSTPATQQPSSPVTHPSVLVHSLPSTDPAQQFVTFPPRPAISDLPPRQEYITQPQRVVSIKPRPPTTTTEHTTQFLRFQEKPVSEQSFIRDNDLSSFDNEKIPVPPQQVLRQQLRPQPRPQRPQFIQQPIVTTEAPIMTTLAPHQPPLSVFMGSDSGEVRVLDVLRALKDAKNIAVLDNIPDRNGPNVFVGPANLNPPQGFGKFELPYLSNIENNRVERKVERFPFFVAPLNFSPPEGYMKIPFPAPHIGSVVVSTEEAMRAALFRERGTTNAVTEDLNTYPSLPEVSPELPGLINDLDSEKPLVTTAIPEPTSARTRPRRPTNVYRPPGRRPVPNSRLRPTQSEENQFLKETTSAEQVTASLYPKRGSAGKRYRYKTTTTENYPEIPLTNEQEEERYFTQTSPQPVSESEIPSVSELPSSTVSNHQFPSTTSGDVQGIFEVSPPSENTLTVVNNGNSGYYQQNQQPVSTEQPISSTQFFEHTDGPSSSPSTEAVELPQTLPPVEEVKSVEKEESFEPSKKSKYTPAAPVKSYPDPTVVKVKSSVRSRTRGRVNYLSQSKEQPSAETHDTKDSAEPVDDNPANVETSPEVQPESEVTTKPTRLSQFYRGSRKPLRTTSPPTRETTTRASSSYTLRSQRRSTTTKSSVPSKRVKKPTTSSYETTTESGSTADFGRKRPTYGASGVSNEIYDERPSSRPSPRRPYFPKQKNVDIVEYESSASTSTTQEYQARKDELVPTEGDAGVTKYPEWNPEESGMDISSIVLTTNQPAESSGEDTSTERKKSVETTKKATDPELEKKSNRRRVRVRVNKRPHDNFEAAESQNVGTVSNILVPPTPSKPNSEPDLYRFSKDNDFDFDTSGKFIGTKNSQHVRNITADIIESTNSFSAPGVENEKDFQELQKVTIADEEKFVATTLPTVEATSSVNEKTEVETTTEAISETTTEPEEVTTEEPEFTTALPDTSSTVFKQSRIIKTSTSHKVSHETEICYKGKCIKTNSADPDKDLRKLVEAANIEARLRGVS